MSGLMAPVGAPGSSSMSRKSVAGASAVVVALCAQLTHGQSTLPQDAYVDCTPNSEVVLIVRGQMNNGCVPHSSTVTVGAASVTVRIIRNYAPGSLCTQAITPWQRVNTIRGLHQGSYDINVLFLD